MVFDFLLCSREKVAPVCWFACINVRVCDVHCSCSQITQPEINNGKVMSLPPGGRTHYSARRDGGQKRCREFCLFAVLWGATRRLTIQCVTRLWRNVHVNVAFCVGRASLKDKKKEKYSCFIGRNPQCSIYRSSLDDLTSINKAQQYHSTGAIIRQSIPQEDCIDGT